MVIDTAELPEPRDPQDKPSSGDGWLSIDELRFISSRAPLVYVEALPVRTTSDGRITQVGLLWRSDAHGNMTRELVAGRVRFGETVREALYRHLENDLGPMALPLLPTSPVPVQVAEYFPIPQDTGFIDERHHAVSLVYVVPVSGDCTPHQKTLDVTWMTPTEVLSNEILADLPGGRGQLVRQILSAQGL